MIFLYERAAKVPGNHLKALRDAGIVPVQVESLDKARLVNAEVPPIEANDMMLSAIEAIVNGQFADNNSRRFLKNLYMTMKAPASREISGEQK